MEHWAKTAAERDGYCLYGLSVQDGCFGRLHIHHIKYRGRGGKDEADNAIVLCAKHHAMVHRQEITEEQLLAIRDKYTKDRSEMIENVKRIKDERRKKTQTQKRA